MLNTGIVLGLTFDIGTSRELREWSVYKFWKQALLPGGLLSRTGVGADPSFGVVEDAGLVPVFARSVSSSGDLNEAN